MVKIRIKTKITDLKIFAIRIWVDDSMFFLGMKAKPSNNKTRFFDYVNSLNYSCANTTIEVAYVTLNANAVISISD